MVCSQVKAISNSAWSLGGTVRSSSGSRSKPLWGTYTQEDFKPSVVLHQSWKPIQIKELTVGGCALHRVRNIMQFTEKLECLKFQSNLYKMTTIGTTQKWSSWTGGHLIKHLYKTTTNQIWSILAGF